MAEPKVEELGGGPAAPTHLPAPKALPQGLNLVVLQLLEKRAHLGAGRKGVTPAGPAPLIPPRCCLGGGTACPSPAPPPTVPTRCPAGRVQVKSWLRTKHSGGTRSCPWMARLTLGM